MKKVFVSALNNINYKKKFTETDPILKMRKIEVLINPEIELSTENEESEEECLSNLGVFFFYSSLSFILTYFLISPICILNDRNQSR